MNGQLHIGYNVSNLKVSIDFYAEVFGAETEFIDHDRNSACLRVYGQEVNLFEIKDFSGYHASLLKALHLGFQVASEAQVNEAYQRAGPMSRGVLKKPYFRFDGDYTLFVHDPDGMPIEVFFGTHHLARHSDLQKGGRNAV